MITVAHRLSVRMEFLPDTTARETQIVAILFFCLACEDFVAGGAAAIGPHPLSLVYVYVKARSSIPEI